MSGRYRRNKVHTHQGRDTHHHHQRVVLHEAGLQATVAEAGLPEAVAGGVDHAVDAVRVDEARQPRGGPRHPAGRVDEPVDHPLIEPPRGLRRAQRARHGGGVVDLVDEVLVLQQVIQVRDARRHRGGRAGRPHVQLPREADPERGDRHRQRHQSQLTGARQVGPCLLPVRRGGTVFGGGWRRMSGGRDGLAMAGGGLGAPGQRRLGGLRRRVGRRVSREARLEEVLDRVAAAERRRDPDDAGENGACREQHQRHRHHARRLVRAVPRAVAVGACRVVRVPGRVVVGGRTRPRMGGLPARAPVVAVERHRHQPEHVERRHPGRHGRQRPQEPAIEERAVQDLVLAEKAGQRRDAGDRERADHHRART